MPSIIVRKRKSSAPPRYKGSSEEYVKDRGEQLLEQRIYGTLQRCGGGHRVLRKRLRDN